MSQPTLAENARLMALLYVVQADASIGCFESKYHYLFVAAEERHHTCRHRRQRRHPADPAWTPVVPTPNHPEYPAAHGCVFGGTGEALRSFYGTSRSQVQLRHHGRPASAPKAWCTAYESIRSDLMTAWRRIWGGMHFRTSVDHGGVLGVKTAKWVVKHHFEAR